MAQRTPLYEAHLDAGARMVDFGGWEMPIAYGSQIEEHQQVRTAAGMFDVSHMTAVDLGGGRVREFLGYLLANDVAKLQQPGKALYSCMLNERGGVIDDLITYYLDERHFRVVVNAATTAKDLAWIERWAELRAVRVTPRRDLAMLAVQGPRARRAVLDILDDDAARGAGALQPFFAGQFGDLFIARTGYTGEDGFEISMPAEDAPGFWEALQQQGVRPCGLGARDTLRLEAGMNLYGQDMDESVTPLEAGLAWTVAMRDEREFIGRSALESQRAAGPAWKFAGLVLQGRGVLRHGQKVVTDAGEGFITSGSFSPTLQCSIALARLPAAASGDCRVEIRGKLHGVKVVKPPFVRNGAACEGII